MTHSGALDAVDRILNRGGDADDVLRAVVAALCQRGIPYVAIRFGADGTLVDGPTAGAPPGGLTVPVVYEGEPVGELELAADDEAFVKRVATLISAHVLAGRDRSGEDGSP